MALHEAQAISWSWLGYSLASVKRDSEVDSQGGCSIPILDEAMFLARSHIPMAVDMQLAAFWLEDRAEVASSDPSPQVDKDANGLIALLTVATNAFHNLFSVA